MSAFPSEDHAADLKDLDLGVDNPPIQRSLGLHWDLKMDTFTFRVPDEGKPYTRRGLLSTVNSLYDPLGFAAPVIIQGKTVLRELTSDNSDWDAPLPQEKEEMWVKWRDSLKNLNAVQIPRMYTPTPSSDGLQRVLYVFSDASTVAIAAVAYLQVTDSNGSRHTGFVMGKAKLAPRPEHTIPRLELCAAVLAVELAELIHSELDLKLDNTLFYTDSKVVLGYIYNETRRFYVYVNNRVQRIRRSTQPNQWNYIRTDLNPADQATRAVPASHLSGSVWLTGPKFLSSPEQKPEAPYTHSYGLVDPALDDEVRPQVSSLKTTTSVSHLGTQRFERFSSWKSLTRALARLIHATKLFKTPKPTDTGECKGWYLCNNTQTVDGLLQAKQVIIRAVQQEAYGREIESMTSGKGVPKGSSLRKLDPFIDDIGLLRVGGRISAANLPVDEKNPFIIPGHNYVASLLIRHYHEQTRHQGRLFTEGAIRTAGLWIMGGKKKVSSIIYRCVICRRLRGDFQTQKMADLPIDRLTVQPPFSEVGLDVFGPWSILTRRTRGGSADSKRWAVMFTCMSVRAVHIEVIEALDTSSFINAFRRFTSIRGPVKHIRSDRGTNFIGACKELLIPSNIINEQVNKFLAEKGCKWTFNPPHSSHMGGCWERMIGLARRILDSMLLQKTSRLTHETLTTLMAEVVAIINGRPLTPVSTDPTDPTILTPSALLTQKVGPQSAPAGEFDVKDLCKRQWRQVQSLANMFWDRWRKQYLSTLQTRSKWQSNKPNLEIGRAHV